MRVEDKKEEKKEEKKDESKDHDLDQVAKTPLLSDIRATRPKAPGRRPPSTVYRDNELVNGNALSKLSFFVSLHFYERLQTERLYSSVHNLCIV